jgi:hypothetical protein
MDNAVFTSDLSAAAKLVRANCRPDFLMRIELDEHGLIVVGRRGSAHHARDHKQMVTWHDMVVTDGRALHEAIRRVVGEFRLELLDPKE